MTKPTTKSLFLSAFSKLFLLSLIFIFAFTNTGLAAAQTALAPRSDDAIGNVTTGQELHTGSAGKATADPDAEHATYDWPFDWAQMGHLNSSYQYYGGSLNNAYFHHGIDMVSNQYNVPVYTRSGGQIVNVENYGGSSLYWEVAVLDPQGYVWQFHHIDTNTIPAAIHEAYAAYQAEPETGGFVEANTHIGNIVQWPQESFGYLFHHIHLNILAAGDIYLNPLEFHDPGAKTDTQDPIIHEIGLFTGTNTLLPGNTVSADTDYSVYIKASDLYQSQVYKLPPHTIQFKLDGASEWTTVWDFRKLPGGSEESAYLHDFYLRNLTQGDYEHREFYINLGFSTSGQREFPKEAGLHSIDVRIADFAGNSTEQSFSWFVTETIPDNSCGGGWHGINKTFTFSSDKPVQDIDLKLFLRHEDRGQIWVLLKGPGDPAPAFIVNTTLDNKQNYNVFINDNETAPLHNGADDPIGEPIFGRMAGPSKDGNLSEFFGRPARGEWTVIVCDKTAGKVGQLIMLDLVLHLPDNEAPVAESQSLKTGYAQAVSVLLKGSDPEGSPLSYRVSQAPLHGTLTGDAPNLVYTPAPGFSGEDQFSFVVNDGELDSEPATVAIQVLPGLFIPLVIQRD